MARSLVSLSLFCLLIQNGFGADSPEQLEFFEAKIRPVLVKHCYECHSASSKEPKGGLLLDTREGIRRGGDSGHGVVPGELDDSLVIGAMKYESFEMPPEQPLPDEVIADFEKWVQMGAADPREGKSALIRQEIDFERARDFWAFRPIESPTVPAVSDSTWGKDDLDAFVLAKLEANRLRPVKDARSNELARRIHFDLIGLPPTPKELDQFATAMSKDADAAIASLVDRLLGSDQFGERWGRHWLDVVRYAESTGMERNATFTRAWRYRDYVIDAFNHDMPFDQFIREQIAGDLLPSQSGEQRSRQLIATGMLALGPKSLNETKKEKFKMDVVDEQIDVVTRGFIGLTASCARCHDHKFDPIPQSEYYSLAGIFTSTETLYGTAKTNGNRNPGRLLAIDGDKAVPSDVNAGAGGAKEEKKYRNQVKGFERRIAALRKQISAAKAANQKQSLRKRMTEAEDDLKRAKSRLRRAIQPVAQTSKDAMLVMAVGESPRIADTKLRIRGEPDEYGREVPRGFLTIASLEDNPELSVDHSGRVELAEWVARESNPLTNRVIVNRIWQHLFGRGIVATVNNFGANGDRPTHPLLLDHLATEFVRDGRSVKKMIRRIMLSRTYRMCCDDQPEALASDPGNRWYWRMNQRRLEAESIRDAMLAVSGKLDLSRQPGSPVERLGEGIVGRNIRADALGGEHLRRSVYLPIVRGAVPEILTLFDFPEPSIVGGVRNVTTVPTQALFMMNSPSVIRYANDTAKRVAAFSDDPEQRVRFAYRLTVSRSPSAEEIERAVQFVSEIAEDVGNDQKNKRGDSEIIAWAGFCQSLLASSEFRYIH